MRKRTALIGLATMAIVYMLATIVCFAQHVPETRLVRVEQRFLPAEPTQSQFKEISQSQLPPQIHQVAMETVKVRSGQGQIHYGSGVHIGGGYILSCYHTIRGTAQGSQAVQWPGGEWLQAEVVATDKQNDLSLKRVAISSIPAGRRGVEVAARYPQRQEPLWLVGYPKGTKLSFWFGLSSGQTYSSGFCVNQPVIPGYSGGPAFTERGEVIGINVMSDFQTETLSVGPMQINTLLTPYASSIIAAREAQCRGGVCPPGGSGIGGGLSGGSGYGQQIPIVPAIPTAPTTPVAPPQPSSPYQQGGNDCAPCQPLDREKLKDEIIKEVIAQIPKPKDGADGKDGPQGPQGPEGPAGPQGDPAYVDYDRIVSDVIARLPSPEPTDADNRILYFTSRSCTECEAATTKIESLKARGAPITIITLSEVEAATKGVPMIWIPKTERKIVGLANVLSYLTMVTY